MDAHLAPHPCPGKEKAFREKYSINTGAYALVFVTILLVIFFVAWFVYDRGIRRNGGFSRFEEIRLGDDGLIENNRTDRVVNIIVRLVLHFFNHQVCVQRSEGRYSTTFFKI